MTAEEALSHPYVAAYHDAEDEPLAPPLDPDYFKFDSMYYLWSPFFTSLTCDSGSKEQLSKLQLKELLYEEVMAFESSINVA